jgi:microcystin degradation protein MlrC
MRVGILGLQHESNTFSPIRTDQSSFEVTRGDDVATFWRGSHHELAGYLAGLDEEGLEPVPTFVATATPSGAIAGDAFESLLQEVETAVAEAGRLDGLLVAAHGAAVAESWSDADGLLLQRLREWTGGVGMVCTLDAHANLSPAMAEACDALIAYRTNPHLDQFDRGLEAARLLARTIRREVTPTQAIALPPMIVNILHQDTGAPPCLPLYALADSIRRLDGVLSVSICLGFPYADVDELGTGFVVVTDGREELARSLAEELADHLLGRTTDFVPDFPPVEEAIAGTASSQGPVCLLDTGDNVGGGSAGDGTTIAHLIRDRGGPTTFVSLYDPESVAFAAEAGVGTRVHLSMGGKADRLHGAPLDGEVTVLSRHEGRFNEPAVRHGGRAVYDMGDTVIVSLDDVLTIQLTSKRIPPFSLNQLLSCGIDPAEFQIVVAKGVHAPLPAYAPVCPTIVRAITPGSTTPDLSLLDYRRRRRPLFPFEEVDPQPAS